MEQRRPISTRNNSLRNGNKAILSSTSKNREGAQALSIKRERAMIQEYMTYLQSIRGLSENTALGYGKDLRSLVRWIREQHNGARWSTITREDIDSYIIYQQHRGLKPSTTNRHLSAISGLYNFMKREGMEIENPCKYESRRKVGERTPNTIDCHDLEKAYEKSIGVTRHLLGILVTTGARIQEVLDLNWSDINFETGAIHITGKGMKERMVYTTPQVTDELQEAWRWAKPTGRIFTIDQRTARHMIWEVLKRCSRARQLSPHAIRHTMATHMASEGVNTTTLQRILGHSDIRTTQKYIDLGQVRVRETMQQHAILN